MVGVVLLGWFFMDVGNIGIAMFAACTFTFLGVQVVEVYDFVYSFFFFLFFLLLDCHYLFLFTLSTVMLIWNHR
jgi:hypothetical protein